MSTRVTTEPGSEQRTRWSAVFAVSLGIVLMALDMTIVAVVLPSVGADLSVSASATQWILLAYSLPLVALSVPAGRWLDGAGPLPAFLLAVSGFAAASLLIALAPTFAVLLAGRAVQGVFGSLIGVLGMPIVASCTRPEHRARAMSIVLTLIPLSGVAGPALGGVLTEAFGWRAVFLINIPLAVLAIGFGLHTIPARLPGRSGVPRPGGRLMRESAVLGAAATAVFLALDALSRAQAVLWPVALAVLAGVALAGWARLPESRPVRSMLRQRQLLLPLLALPAMTTGVSALNFLVPYFLSDVLQSSPRTIGLVLLAISVPMAVMSPIAGVLADRFGNRPITLLGTAVGVLGMVSLLWPAAGAGPLHLVGPLALVGVANGLFAGPNTTAILAHTPTELVGTSSGVTALLRTLGFSIGPALGALTWTLTSGGTLGLHTAAVALACISAVGLGAIALSRPRES